MIIGKKVALQPNKEQEKAFFRFSGTGRFVWNLSLAYWRDHDHNVTLKELMKHLQQLKSEEEYEWISLTPEAVTKQEMKDLLRAAKDYRKENKGEPKFKKKGKCRIAFYQRTDNIRKTDDSHIKITRIRQPVRCKGLKGTELPERILNPRVSYDGKYWYLSYSYEEEVKPIEKFERERLGIDLGIHDLAVFSNGEYHRNINNDKHVIRLEKKLKRLQRKSSAKYEKGCTENEGGKKVYHKTRNIIKLEQQIRMVWRKINNIRKTYMYEVVKAAVKTKPAVIIMEDLDVKEMMQNPKIARRIQEEKLYEFKRIMKYKCEYNGIGFVMADRYYPSSQICSCCKNRKTDLKLSDRVYICNKCQNKTDRDLNAAINLEKYPVR